MNRRPLPRSTSDDAEQLVAQLFTAHPQRARMLVARLVTLDAAAVPALLAALQTCHTQAGHRGPRPTRSRWLVRTLTHTHPQPPLRVAWWITQTIIQIGPPAVAPLLVVLQEKNVLFWNDTVRMLGTIGTPEGILALIEEVRTVRIADDTLRLIDSVGNITVDGFYRHAVKGTLTRATHAMVLAAALSSTEARANETLDPDSRWFVLVAALSSTAALPAVTPLLAAGDRYLRHVAVDVLSHVAAWGASALVDLLLPHLFDRDPVVRTATAYHLADRCDPRTTSTLIAALADSQPDVRWLATCTVGVVGDARALDPLTTVANDPRELPVIRQAATEARDRLRRTAGRDSA